MEPFRFLVIRAFLMMVDLICFIEIGSILVIGGQAYKFVIL